MKSLPDCPVEIMHSILECLPAASLRNLCLVSRALRDVAEPLLYADLVLIWLGGDPPPSFMLLLQNFQQRPQLAKYVQYLTFSESYTRNGWRISVDSSELASLIEIVDGINPPFRDLWIKELENGTPDAFIMLFLSLVPNITLLHLTGKFCDDNRLLGRMLRASLCQTVDCDLPRFRRLRKVYMDIQTEPPTIRYPEMQNTADILSLFYLPAARSISAVIDNPAVFMWPADAPNPSNLTSLHIRGVREGNLGRILATTKSLKTLEWRWKYEPILRNETNNEIINLDQIAKDLSFVKDTLEDLQLSGAVSSDPELDDDLPVLQIQGSLKPLRRFEKLHKLVIPQLFLTGFSLDDDPGNLEDMMPKNIHHLTITDDMTWLEQNVLSNGNLFMLLEDWWRNLQIHTPSFNSLKLETMKSDERWSAGQPYNLDFMCDHFGIRLKYSFQKPFPYDYD